MVEMFFFLRFKSQLQRIRPDLIPRLEETVVHAAQEAGGKITGDHSLIRVSFDENSLGFWLDILLCIETVIQATEGAATDLYGYSLLLGKAAAETPKSLCRFLSGGDGGVFLDQAATKALGPYAAVEEQGHWTAGANRYGMGQFSRLKEIKILVPTIRPDLSLQENGIRLSDMGQRPAVFIANQSFEGKRDKLYFRVAGFVNNSDENFFPLFVRFGSGGLNALTDAWASWMRPSDHKPIDRRSTDRKSTDRKPIDRKSENRKLDEEINEAWKFLFRERFRDKPSSFAIRTASRFFKLLLTLYRNLAQDEGKTPVIILENIQTADQTLITIIMESLRGWQDFLLLATCTGEIDDASMERWRSLLPQLPKSSGSAEAPQRLPDLPPELWEIAYACLLFGRYFPVDLFPRLFAEAGKSPLMISRAFSLLHTMRIFDTPLDPRPWHRDFQSRAEIMLGERKNAVRSIVRSRLLAWVNAKKINPCLRLLRIIQELNSAEKIDDHLLLRAIQCEISGVDRNVSENAGFYSISETIAGAKRAPVIRYILETSLALHSGNIKTIHAAFSGQPPHCSAFPLLKAQALINQSLYYLGMRKHESAVEAVKESTILCQGSGDPCLSHAYRLFALANLLQQRIGETINYLSFALENAAKSGGFQDIGMAAYYAASVQLLYGNLSRSRTLAEKAHRHFLKAGNPEWADRSRFLEGRVAFETGSYRQAIDIFEDIRQNPEGDHAPDKDGMLEAWAYRARVCCQSPSVPKPANGGRDAELFEIEALCLRGDFSAVAERSGIFAGSSDSRPSADGVPSSSTGENFLCIERPDWHSGFAQCELLYFSWNELKERILCAYQSLAGGKEAMNTMQQVLRSRQFPEIDPCDTFYYYAWYRVLEQTGSSQVDISTAVSVAFKRLQSRAGRIDDIEIRRQYLTQPYWNKALGQAAKEFKLV